jgi:hypothetical protein
VIDDHASMGAVRGERAVIRRSRIRSRHRRVSVDRLRRRFRSQAAPASPHFSQGQLICDGDWWIGAKATGTVAPSALRGFVFVCPAVGLVDDAADWARGGGACQAGEARALAASARRRAARPHSSAAGQAEAMAILMRRQEMRTSAPIFKSLSLMVPQWRPQRRFQQGRCAASAQIST